MKIPPASAKTKGASWKQLPTLALAGCTLAGMNVPPTWQLPRLAIVPPDSSRGPAKVWTGADYQMADYAAPRQFAFQRDFVLGTSFDLVVWATQKRHAEFVETVVLAEIDRLCRVLSVYDPQSEVSRLNRNGSVASASPDLLALLHAYEQWSALTGGALSAQLGNLLQIWQTAEAANLLPASIDLAAAVGHLHRPGWQIDAPTRHVSRLGHQLLNLNSLGKGYIIRQAMLTAHAYCFDVFGALLNIGGDISVWGSGSPLPGSPWRIFCADPSRPQENAPPLTTIDLSNRAIATSAGYERGYTVAGKRYSHIIDPRTGWPARGVASATVIANDSLAANALATALCVLKPTEGLNLISLVKDAEALIVAADGTLFRSPGFGAFEVQAAPVPSLTPSTPTPAIAPYDVSGQTGTASTPAPDPNAAASTAPSTNAPAASPTPDPSAAAGTPAPAPTPPPAPAALPPLTVGQAVNLTSNDPVSFTRGASHIKRPVRAEEVFSVTAVTSDDVTITDRFGNQATVARGLLTVFTQAPAPIAATPPPAPAPATANNAPVTAANPSSDQWPSGYQVTLNIELPTPTTPPGKVRRPYVFWWIEDSSGKPLHSVSLWGNAFGHVKEMTEWWREVGMNHPVPWVKQTTRATRQPGKYQIVWDGKDDDGKPVPKGNYIMVLEVAREFAGHDIVRTPIACQDTPVQGTIPGGKEFLDTPYTYGTGS